MDATRALREEHRLILRVLGALELALDEAESSGKAERGEIERFLEFFRDFADGCHHAREEDELFVALDRVGARPDGGPIGVALAEHAQGREWVAALGAALEAQDAGDPGQTSGTRP